MKPNAMLERLREGEVLLGLAIMYPAAGIIEGMAGGWDMLWIDGQHGQISYDTALAMVRTIDLLGLPSLLRVPGHEHSFLGLYADMDPTAIMVPMVNNKEQAQFIVKGLRFPPLGSRSYGGRRVIDRHGRDYYKDTHLMVVAQIETVESVKNAPEIIGTDGVDMLFFGPDDMKVQMGLPINTATDQSPELRQAMTATAKAAKAAGKFCGCVGGTPASAKMAQDLGYQLIIGGGDIGFMRTLAADRLKELRNALGSAGPKPTVAPGGSGVYGG